MFETKPTNLGNVRELPRLCPIELPMPDREASKSLMRSLGEFVGHIARAVTTDVTQKPSTPSGGNEGPRSVHRRSETHEEVVDAPAQGGLPNGETRMILRRTVIEEVEMLPGPADRFPGGRAGTSSRRD